MHIVLTPKRIENGSHRVSTITHVTPKRIPKKRKVMNPYEVFTGIDGKNYRISYPSELYIRTNCYAFVMGWRSRGTKNVDYIPGFLAKKSLSLQELPSLVEADLETVGRKVYELIYDIPEHLPEAKEGYWIKALYCKIKGLESIHFMFKDENSGRWLHKMGWEEPPKFVTKMVSYKTDREALMESKEMRGYSKEEIEDALNMFFRNGDSGGIIPLETSEEDKDNAIYVSIAKTGTPYDYEPLWAMRISY